MSNEKYQNFVRPSTTHIQEQNRNYSISGEQAKKLYLEEVKEVKEPFGEDTECSSSLAYEIYINKQKQYDCEEFKDKDLFLMVQNNKVDKLKSIFDEFPEKVHTLDEFGWSLLMIACQANAIETASDLVKRGIDMSISDRAGNTARSLVIKNKNLALVDILLSNKAKEVNKHKHKAKKKHLNKYKCEVCNGTVFPDKDDHLCSTVHNLHTSKGRKSSASYKIPQTNKGYQMMLKVGWDKNSGLGPYGSGNMYPVKAKEKKDRKGLGHQKKKEDSKNVQPAKPFSRATMIRNNELNKKLEVDFRRQFY